MYYINKNLSRFEIGVINSFKRVNNCDDLTIYFTHVRLSNFIEEGYQNKISAHKPALIIKKIVSESFYFNRNQKETNIENIENDYYITDFQKITESENGLELEFITWKNEQPYDENEDTDFIIWKIKAASFELRWDQFTYW